MKRVFHSGLLLATAGTLVSAPADACSRTSAPGRLACAAADVVSPAAKRVDDVAAHAAARVGREAMEQANVRVSRDQLKTMVSPRSDVLNATQAATQKAQREMTERTSRHPAVSAPKRMEREAVKTVERESHDAVQTVQRVAPAPPGQKVVTPEAAGHQLQQLRAANTAKLTPAAKKGVEAAIGTAEKSAAAARQQKKATAEALARNAEPRQPPKLAGAKPMDNAALAEKHAAAKAPKLAPGAATQVRLGPGTATHNGTLATVADPKWMVGRTSSPLPGQIAQRMAGRKFRNFAHLRESVWREIGNDPVLSRSFESSDVKLMQTGRAPSTTVASQKRGRRVRYEIDHTTELRDGGAAFDLNNLRIKTPDAHVRKITRKLNRASGAL
jgi:hypothetical protein